MIARGYPVLCIAVAFIIGTVPALSAQAQSIDTTNSKLLVYAFKSGLFSGFADNHEVAAPIKDGTIDEAAQRVTFRVEVQRMKVLDPHLPSDKREQVQQRMLGAEVLDSTHFPLIKFESMNVRHGEGGDVVVTGRLTLHGTTQPISVSVRSENGRYRGTCTLKQRDFGITPISIAGGTVKVKDELKIEFDIRANPGIATK